MFNAARGLAIASIMALGSLATPFNGTPAMALPFHLERANIEQVSQGGNIQQVVDAPRRFYWRNRLTQFPHATPSQYRRDWRHRDRNWRYRDRSWGSRERYWRYRHDRFRDWRGHRNHFYYGPFWGYDSWWDYDPPIVFPPPVSYDRSAHVEWCLAHYRSYNPRTNTWVAYSGRVYQCDSPYD